MSDVCEFCKAPKSRVPRFRPNGQRNGTRLACVNEACPRLRPGGIDHVPDDDGVRWLRVIEGIRAMRSAPARRMA